MENLLQCPDNDKPNKEKVSVTPTPKKPKVVMNLDSDLENESSQNNIKIPSNAISINNHTVIVYKWKDLKSMLNKVTAIITLPSGVDPAGVVIRLCDSASDNTVCSKKVTFTFK